MAYFSPGKLHKSSAVKGLFWGHQAHVCGVCVSLCECVHDVHVGMCMDTSWVNALRFSLVEPLLITPNTFYHHLSPP